MQIANIYHELPIDLSNEVFEDLVRNDNVQIERIVSTGQATPMGTWLEQEKNEFVLLLSGKAGLQFKGGEELHLMPGDHLIIRPGQEHRVTYTQKEPVTIWLAIHY